MPNWATNQIHTRNEEDFEKLKSALINDNGDVDFNKIIPMPQTIKNTISPNSIYNTAYFLIEKPQMTNREIIQKMTEFAKELDKKSKTDIASKNLFEEMKKIAKDNEYTFFNKLREKAASKQEHDNLQKSLFNRPFGNDINVSSVEEYGKNILENWLLYDATDWYDWSIQNWGTKWNACETNIEKTCVTFNTPWDGIQEIIEKIAEKAGVPLYYRMMEEQFTQFGLECILENGEITDMCQPDAESFELFMIAKAIDDPNENSYRWSEELGEVVSEWRCEYDYDFTEDDFENTKKHPGETDMYQEFMNE